MMEVQGSLAVGVNIAGFASAAIGAAYSAYLRPRLAEEFFVAEAGAIQARVVRGIRGGALQPDDRCVINLLSVLEGVTSDPHGTLAQLQKMDNEQTLGPAKETVAAGSHTDTLHALWRQLKSAASGFAVDGSPWWLLRRVFRGRPLELPLAALLLLGSTAGASPGAGSPPRATGDSDERFTPAGPSLDLGAVSSTVPSRRDEPA